MNIKQQYKRYKTWQLHAFEWTFDKNELHHCANCNNDFVGNHCPYCSQKAGVGKITWNSVIKSAAEVWGMHNRSLIYYLWQLIWRPGHFISDYINGKQQVSFPPVKMLVIMGALSLLVDYLFAAYDVTKEFVAGESPLIEQYFAWIESSPGWGWLSLACMFIIPTWCIFRYAPLNAKHSLPQGFFIQVFMSLQVLIVDDLADFFGDFFYILLPLCYFYVYRQLFGYDFWGNFWRVFMMLLIGIQFAILIVSIIELIMYGPGTTYATKYESMRGMIFFSFVPLIACMHLGRIQDWLKKH